MNYYEAMQRVKDGKWEYTRNGIAVGYCREYREIAEAKEEFQATAHKHHSCGHDTKEEAEECYKQYILDHRLRFSKMSNQQNRCKVCSEYTEGFAELDTCIIVLCDKHRNKEEVSKLYDPSVLMYSSW